MRVFLVHNANSVRDRFSEIISELPGIEMAFGDHADDDTFAHVVENKPEVAIVDLQLRNGGGLDLIRRLSELRKAPILMALASADSPLYRQKSMAAGAACFFDKDTDQDALIEALRKAGETAGSRHSTS